MKRVSNEVDFELHHYCLNRLTDFVEDVFDVVRERTSVNMMLLDNVDMTVEEMCEREAGF